MTKRPTLPNDDSESEGLIALPVDYSSLHVDPAQQRRLENALYAIGKEAYSSAVREGEHLQKQFLLGWKERCSRIAEGALRGFVRGEGMSPYWLEVDEAIRVLCPQGSTLSWKIKEAARGKPLRYLPVGVALHDAALFIHESEEDEDGDDPHADGDDGFGHLDKFTDISTREIKKRLKIKKLAQQSPDKLAQRTVEKWKNRKGLPPPIGRDPKHFQRILYKPNDLLAFIIKQEEADVVDKSKLLKELKKRARLPK